uniref:U3 small nucleolar RNA-associated protein 6 homolog n=2 Tax=Tetranychus urticae TaxID=32264 RepID=T1K6B6_TETUR
MAIIDRVDAMVSGQKIFGLLLYLTVRLACLELLGYHSHGPCDMILRDNLFFVLTMAEVVQYHLEELLDVFVSVREVKLFSAEEVKKIVNDIRSFEYKIQKPSKTKHDYLKYIQYVQTLLDLMKKRKVKCINMLKYKEIEIRLINLVKKLFRKVVYSNQHDLVLWYTWINFCRKMGLREDISKVYVRMLQVHPDKEEVWIAAAKYQFEEMRMPTVARNLLQTSLQDNPDSIKLWEEYFRFELLHSDMVRKRQEILGQDLDSEKYQNISRVNFTLDESDAVVSGKIAVIVFKNSVPVLSKKLAAAKGFFDILDEFEPGLRTPVKVEMIKILEENFPDTEELYDIKAHCVMDQYYACRYKNLSEDDQESFAPEEKRIELAFNIYRKGITKVPTVKMWNLFISFNLRLLSKSAVGEDQEKLLDNLLLIFDECWRSELMSRHAFLEWILALQIKDNFAQMDNLMAKGCEKWSKYADIWYLRLKVLSTRVTSKEDVKHLFPLAFKSIDYKIDQDEDEDEEKIEQSGLIIRNMKKKTIDDVWNLFIEWSSKHLHPTEVIKRIEKYFSELLGGGSCLVTQRKISSLLKPELLRKSIELKKNGLELARNYYDKYKHHPPAVASFFKEMIQIERNQNPIDYKRIVNIYEDLISYFGENDHQIWLDYCKFTLENKKPTTVGTIHNRACKTLIASEVSRFVSSYCLLQNKNYNS